MKKYLKAKRLWINPELEGPRITAIYCLLYKDKIVYIGKTENLKSRISSHKSSLFRRRWFNSFRFIRCNADVLDKYERRWIRKFRPQT